MAVALSPWPSATATVSLPKATKRLALAIGSSHPNERPESDELAQRVGAAASAMIEQYAPNAPQELKDEAVIRFAGYLAHGDFGTVAKEEIGPRSMEHVTNHAAMFRNSGAAALLSRWRVRRAGKIG